MTRDEPFPVPLSDADQALVGVDASPGVLRLRGEHDITTVSALAVALRQAVATEGGDLVVDLSEVQFMDASTIGVIIGARNWLALESRGLTVRAPSVRAQRVLDVCGLADLLDPSPAATGATPVIGASGALGTWVAVAATGRAQRRDDDVAGTDRGGDVPVVPAPAVDARRREAETQAPADHGAR